MSAPQHDSFGFKEYLPQDKLSVIMIDETAAAADDGGDEAAGEMVLPGHSMVLLAASQYFKTKVR
jgi:hypothetical protein